MSAALIVALIEAGIKLMPAIMQAWQTVEKARAENRDLTPEEHKQVAAVVAAGKAHDDAMGIPASAENAPHGPDFTAIA